MPRRDLNLELYRKMYRVRRAEEEIVARYGEDEIKTPVHLSIGAEAISAGVALALAAGHQAFGYHRSHGLYITMTDDTRRFFAELYGKATGVVRGRGGSMHVAAPERGLMSTSAIVASTIALAVGAAFANKRKDNGKVVASCFGDGAIEEGAFFEALNVACLMRLPVVFVCEDNGLAVDVVASQRQGFRSIPAVVSAYECDLYTSRSRDPEQIYTLTRQAIENTLATMRPAFLHLEYRRLLQHVGVGSDFPSPSATGFAKAGYRSREEYEAHLANEPVKLQRVKLSELGVDEATIVAIERRIDDEIADSVADARRAPAPDDGEVLDHVYAS